MAQETTSLNPYSNGSTTMGNVNLNCKMELVKSVLILILMEVPQWVGRNELTNDVHCASLNPYSNGSTTMGQCSECWCFW